MPEYLPLDTKTGKVEVTSSKVGQATKPIDFTNVVVIGIGAAGGDKNYLHTQTAPAVSWAVPHMLAKFPAVAVVDSGGSQLIPDVHYDDANHVTISFGSATSGKAYLN